MANFDEVFSSTLAIAGKLCYTDLSTTDSPLYVKTMSVDVPNPLACRCSPNGRLSYESFAAAHASDEDEKLIIVMIGLPARGKSYITKKICRYLNWLQHDAKIFNVGDRRRKLVSHSDAPESGHQASEKRPESEEHTAAFFDPDNTEAQRMRESVAMQTLDELLDYLLLDGGTVALFDATNSTCARRQMLMERVMQRKAPELSILFLESQCFDNEVCP